MEKVFFKERTVYISQDFMLKMVRVKIDISKRCQKQKNGLFLEVAAHSHCVMKQESNAFICTPYDILMLHARLNVAYNLKCCNSFRARKYKNNNGQICSCYG